MRLHFNIKDEIMKRSLLAFIVASLPMATFAADELNGSVWKTVDD